MHYKRFSCYKPANSLNIISDVKEQNGDWHKKLLYQTAKGMIVINQAQHTFKGETSAWTEFETIANGLICRATIECIPVGHWLKVTATKFLKDAVEWSADGKSGYIEFKIHK